MACVCVYIAECFPPWNGRLGCFILLVFTITLVYAQAGGYTGIFSNLAAAGTDKMPGINSPLALLALLGVQQALAVDGSWHAPNATDINNLDQVLDNDGVYGFIFDSSQTPDKEYGKYNWCNMPHARPREYPKAPKEYKLQYVEVVCLQESIDNVNVDSS